MPRESLIEGEKPGKKGSPRITLRMNDETKKILEAIDENDKFHKSDFIREAIIYYASSAAYRSKINPTPPSMADPSVITKETEQPDIPVRVLHKPAWQR